MAFGSSIGGKQLMGIFVGIALWGVMLSGTELETRQKKIKRGGE